MNNKIKNKHLIFPIITAVVSLSLILLVTFKFNVSKNKTYVEFLNYLSTKKVSTVYFTDSPKLKFKLDNNKIYQTDNPRINNLKETLLKKGIQVLENSPTNSFYLIFMSSFVVSIISIVLISLKSSKLMTNKLSLDSLNATAISNSPFTFKDVAGNEEAKESVQDIIDFLKNPEKYASYGARMPKGIILYGDPGTGKTLLAKAVAGEANVPFYAVSGSDFIQIYVGVGASRIRQLFKKAKSHGKAVIFIDEIDAIGKQRSTGKSGGSDERDQTLNALLTEMSGFNEKDGIVIIAATNRLDMLDDALLRPGRFDRHIEVSLPDISAREKILNLHLQNKPVNNIKIKDLAQKTAYFSGAKLENLINEAAIIACKENSTFIENNHINKAFSIVIAGHEKQNRSHIKNKDNKITAYHEIGHALVSLKVVPENTISKITIIPSTKGAGGYTLSIPEDNLYTTKNYFKKRIMVLLGGRAAEELIFGPDYVTTGAHNDLKRCTNIAFNMISNYGMGKTLGLLNMEELINLNIDKNNMISECKNLINDLYEQTKNLILKNKTILESMTDELLLKETLQTDDIEKYRDRP